MIYTIASYILLTSLIYLIYKVIYLWVELRREGYFNDQKITKHSEGDNDNCCAPAGADIHNAHKDFKPRFRKSDRQP